MNDETKQFLSAVPTGLATLWLVAWVFHMTVPPDVWWAFPYCFTVAICGFGIWFLAAVTLLWLADEVIPNLYKRYSLRR